MKLNLKNDIVFKAFFTKKGNEKYLKSFLESLLEENIDEIEVVGEASLKQLTIADKMGRLYNKRRYYILVYRVTKISKKQTKISKCIRRVVSPN